jgi:hypothetical protein
LNALNKPGARTAYGDLDDMMVTPTATAYVGRTVTAIGSITAWISEARLAEHERRLRNLA